MTNESTCLKQDGKSLTQKSSEYSFFHHGVAVDNIDKYLKTLKSIFPSAIVTKRHVDNAYMENLVGVHGVEVSIAMMEFFPGHYLELLQWNQSFDSKDTDINLTTPGVSHLSLYSENAERFYDRIKSIEGIKLIGKNVTKIPVGPNTGAKVFFVQVHDYLYLEIFERPSKFQ